MGPCRLPMNHEEHTSKHFILALNIHGVVFWSWHKIIWKVSSYKFEQHTASIFRLGVYWHSAEYTIKYVEARFFKTTGIHLPVYALYNPEHKDKCLHILLISLSKIHLYVQSICILKILLFTGGIELINKFAFTSSKI